jgi:hypothetical protein
MLLVPVNEQRPSVFASDRRANDRIDVALWTRIGLSDDSEYPVRITNISCAGLMAMTPCPASEDIAVRVKIGEIGWVDGIIAWRMGDRIGIEFDTMMTDHDFLTLAPYCI